MARHPDKPRAVVLTRFSAMGDVAIAVPPVYDLCLANPDLTVVFVTRRRLASIMVNPPANLVTEGIDTDRYKGITGMWRLAAQLRKKYNIVAFIDLHDVIRTKLLRLYMRLHNVKVTSIRKGRRQKKELVRKGAQTYLADGGTPLPTTESRYRNAIERAGFSAPHSFVSLFHNESVSPSDNKCRIGIAPFAAHQGKIYPSRLMKQVVDALADRQNTEIYLFGAGEKETALLSAWAAGKPNVVNMASRNEGLVAELRLMSTLNAMIAMDSANMHLAAIAGVPRIVAVWGATHPAAGFTPFMPHSTNTPHIINVEIPLHCRPCSVYGNRQCRRGDYHCLHSISPHTILTALEDI